MNFDIFRMPESATVSSNLLGLQRKLAARIQIHIIIMSRREIKFKVTSTFQMYIKAVKTDPAYYWSRRKSRGKKWCTKLIFRP